MANAVLDGTDCVMLSGETAGGQYPVEAVKLMASVCVEAESSIRYDRLFQETLYDVRELGTLSIKEAIASSAVRVRVGVRMSWRKCHFCCCCCCCHHTHTHTHTH